MDIQELAQELRQMYDTAPLGEQTTWIRLFGIKYADELARFSPNSVVAYACLPHSYGTEVSKGRNLAKYVELKREDRLPGPQEVPGPMLDVDQIVNAAEKTAAKSVTDKVAAIFRSHLESRFGDQLVFDPIRVVPKLSQFGDEYLYVYIVFDGDADVLDPNWVISLYRRMRSELLDLGVTSIPVHSFVERKEYLEIKDQVDHWLSKSC